MEINITAAYLAKHLSEVLTRVHDRGETFVVERHGENIATLGPVIAPQGITLRQFLARLADFPRPDDRFADDLEAIRAEQARMPLKMPEWPK